MHPLNLIAEKAVQILKTGSPGDSYTESELSQKLGIDCSPGSEGKLRIRSAIKVCMREHHILWQWDRPKSGPATLVCGDAARTIEAMDAERKRINRTTIRLGRKSMCLNESELSEKEKSRYRAMQVVATMGQNLSKANTLNKIISGGFDVIAPDTDKILQLMKS